MVAVALKADWSDFVLLKSSVDPIEDWLTCFICLMKSGDMVYIPRAHLLACINPQCIHTAILGCCTLHMRLVLFSCEWDYGGQSGSTKHLTLQTVAGGR